jgi:hypothetical protein
MQERGITPTLYDLLEKILSSIYLHEKERIAKADNRFNMRESPLWVGSGLASMTAFDHYLPSDQIGPSVRFGEFLLFLSEYSYFYQLGPERAGQVTLAPHIFFAISDMKMA